MNITGLQLKDLCKNMETAKHFPELHCAEYA